MTESEEYLACRAREAITKLGLAATPAGRILARRRVENVRLQIMSHRRPHLQTLEMIEDALDRSGAAEIERMA